MKNFEFKSQICTNKEQSERLLALGLKKETADMTWFKRNTSADFECCTSSYTEWKEEILPIADDYTLKDIIPAWSLHRLLCMLPRYVRKEYIVFGRKYIAALDLIIDEDLGISYKEGVDEPRYDEVFYAKDIYTSLYDCIEWLIKEGYFNKDYLEEKK